MPFKQGGTTLPSIDSLRGLWYARTTVAAAAAPLPRYVLAADSWLASCCLIRDASRITSASHLAQSSPTATWAAAAQLAGEATAAAAKRMQTGDVRRALDRRDTTALPSSLLPLVHLVGDRNVLERARAELPSSTHAALSRLSSVVDALSQQGLRVVVDLAEVRPWTYYTGFVFSLWATGVPRVVCAGGRYDQLVGRFGVDRPAVGATFDVDAVLRVQGGA